MKIPGGAVARAGALIAHALWGVVVTLLAPAHSLTDTRTGQNIVRFWHKGLLSILGVRLHTLGKNPRAPTLIVANHISWLDIAALGALCPGHFIAKSEISAWPVIGWLAAQAGTFYIVRGDRRASADVATRMTEAFMRDHSVILFPEGTSTDGQDVLPFHARLFSPAIEGNCPVQPVALAYPSAEHAVHPAAPFIGNDTLLHHLWGVLRARGEFAVEVRFLAPELPTNLTAKELANQTRDLILAHKGHLNQAPLPEL